MTAQILIIEDEPAIQELLTFTIAQAGLQPLRALNITQAQQWLQTHTPDLILLDWMLPGTSGIEYAMQLRNQKSTKNIPILMLTARSEESDKLRGLDGGADDYMTKPFSPRELVARIKALLRRAAPQTVGEALHIGQLTLDPTTHRVTAGEKPLNLGPTEYKLLQFLMQQPERVHSREQLLNHVWGNGVYVEDRTVDVQIKRLRHALEPAGLDKLVQTVRGSGYRLSTQPI
jgi:two-component system, OmpR family, phosphate regulon response regulator PhoB